MADGAPLAESSADPGRRSDSSRGPHLPLDEAPASGSSINQEEMMLRMVLSVCALAGLLSAPPLVAQTTQKSTSARAAKPAGTVNLNTATSAELETLPGVGAKMAARIIEYRQKKGPFK